MKISRGGAFDESPDLRGRASTRWRGRRVRRSSATTDACGCAPPRWSSRWAWTRSGWTCTAATAAPVVETAAMPTARLGLRHAQRRVRGPPPLPAGGRVLRPRREGRARTTARAATSRSGTPTCSPRTRRWSSRPAGHRTTRARTGPAPSSTRTTSRSRSSTTRLSRPGRWPGPSSTTATAPTTTSRAAEEYAHPLRRRPVHRVHLRRAADARDPRGLHRPHRPRRAAAAVGAGLPPVPLVPVHAGRGRGGRRPAPRARHPVRRAVAGHRVHGRLPRLHLGHRVLPGRRRACSRRLRRRRASA